MNDLALFAGAGGGILGGLLRGYTPVCAVERDAYAAAILAQRQNDGVLPIFPIWSDITTFDGRSWRGIVESISAGFPCQDISVAGSGEGISGERSGLWSEVRRIIGEVRPKRIRLENSPALTSRGLGVVLGDLAALGFNAKWGVLGADAVGAPHKRERIWILADAVCDRSQGLGENRKTPGPVGLCSGARRDKIKKIPETLPAWPAEPELGRVANGVAYRVDRIRALGNGQVPRVEATAFNYLSADEA